MEKTVLAEFIYKLGTEVSYFYCGGYKWSYPSCGYSYNDSLPSKFMVALGKSDILREPLADVICVLGDWESVVEGIVFTGKSLYVKTPKNKSNPEFHLSYDEITGLDLVAGSGNLIIWKNRVSYTIDTRMWNRQAIFDFLQFATGTFAFAETSRERVGNVRLSTLGENVGEYGAKMAGTIYSDISNASSIYADDKILSPRGHGFAAERANHAYDILHGKKAEILGDDNLKNGPDRQVDGVLIQSKYCRSGPACISECFDSSGFRYYNADGTPMQIEVPSDFYEDAVAAMERRIQNHEVKGVTDPAEARNIIRKGHFTYAQAKNIAKAGTIDSIRYDAQSGAIVATSAFGVTAAITFAVVFWREGSFEVATKAAVVNGLKVGGNAFLAAVLAGQLSKAGLNSLLVESSKDFVKILGPKASAKIINALRSGKNIYGGAAMNSLAKMLRSNFITSLATIAVLSIGDITSIFRGRISGAQLVKNLVDTTASVAGGTGGWLAGSAAGAKVGAIVGSIFPGAGTVIGGAAGTVIGGLCGAFAGGSVAAKASNKVTSIFIEDDAEKMVRIIEEVFTDLADEYLISQAEAEMITAELQKQLTGKKLKDMFESSDRKKFARAMLEDLFVKVAHERQHVTLPTPEQMQEGLREVLEELPDEEADETCE